MFSIPSKSNPYFSFSTYRPLCVRAIDAIQLFDYESKLAKEFTISQHLKIIIVGFGNFIQFPTLILVCQGHTVVAHSSSDHSTAARKLDVSFLQNSDALSEEHREVILLCSSIISTERVLLMLLLQCLKHNTLFVDFHSVKEFHKKLLFDLFPSNFDIFCTHPMFGPESTPDGWTGLPFVFKKVRILEEEHRVSPHEKFLNAFSREGYKMIEMSCKDHNLYAAGSRFITHAVGRILQGLMLQSMSINTNFLSLHHVTTIRTSKPLLLCAIDAAQHFDYESKLAKEFTISQRFKISVVAIGNFGHFLATTLVHQGHTILAYSHSDHSIIARNFALSSLASSSSKNFPRSSSLIFSSPILTSSALTQYLDLSSHLTDFIFEKVRILNEENHVSHCEKFLNAFSRESYRIVEMSCEDHDRYAAASQFITRTIRKILEELMLESTLIITNFLSLHHATTARTLKPLS
ncbi:hypothetical protein S245_020797 [Arachis hypogaea]